MIKTTLRPAGIAAADDGTRWLLMCVLHDARYLHYDAKDACPGCRALGDVACSQRCEDLHDQPVRRYHALEDELEDYRGITEDTSYPLTGEDLETLTRAVAEAITWRQARTGADSRALLAAYHELAAAVKVPAGPGRARRRPGRRRG